MQCHGSIYRYTSTIYTVYRYLTGRHADTLFRRRYRYKRGKIPPCESSCDLTGTRAALPSSPNSSLLNLCPFMARHCNRAPVLFDYGTPCGGQNKRLGSQGNRGWGGSTGSHCEMAVTRRCPKIPTGKIAAPLHWQTGSCSRAQLPTPRPKTHATTTLVIKTWRKSTGAGTVQSLPVPVPVPASVASVV
jgi:hypothetical protein